MKEWGIQFEIRIHPFDWTKESELHEEKELVISTFPSLHAGATVGVRVLYQDKVLIYSADTRPNEWIQRQERIDLLIHEATRAVGSTKTHTGLDELLRDYSMDRIKRLIAVHLTDHEPYGEVLAQQEETILAKVSLGP